jgi:hypothetical protein
MQVRAVKLSHLHFVDAFIYNTSLYCWTFSGELVIYRVSDIEKLLSADNENLATCYALFHSDGVGSNSEMAEAWKNAWVRCGAAREFAVIDASAIPYTESRIDMDAAHVMDMDIYYNRLYLATDGGLHSIGSVHEGALGSRVTAARRTRDACHSVSTGWGMVAASGGTRGLRLLFNDFGVSGVASKDRRLGDESIRAEIGFGSVVNHRSRAEFHFYAGELQEPKSHVISDVQETDQTYSGAAENILVKDARLIDYAVWEGGRLVVLRGDTMFSVSVVRSGASRHINRVRRIARYENGGARVVSVHPVVSSFVVETQQGLEFVDGEDKVNMLTGPLVSCRSYPRSMRYKWLMTATNEAGLWFIARDVGPRR